MASPVVIVGVGALGSHLALLLRNIPNPIRVVDFDRIEQKNVLSQFHTKLGVGRNKVQGLQQAMLGMFGTKMEAIPHKLTPDNADAILGGAALVCDCTDSYEARQTIINYVKSKGIPCLHGAMSAGGTVGQVAWTEHFTPDKDNPDDPGGGATCEDGRNLPFHGLVSSWLAILAQRFLGKGEKRSFLILPTSVVYLAGESLKP